MRKSTEHAALSTLPHMDPNHFCMQELLITQVTVATQNFNYFTYALWFLT